MVITTGIDSPVMFLTVAAFMHNNQAGNGEIPTNYGALDERRRLFVPDTAFEYTLRFCPFYTPNNAINTFLASEKTIL